MQKMYVIALLMLAVASTHINAAEKAEKAQVNKQNAQEKPERLPEVELKAVDELEQVIQSAYEYNDQQVELGASGD